MLEYKGMQGHIGMSKYKQNTAVFFWDLNKN